MVAQTATEHVPFAMRMLQALAGFAFLLLAALPAAAQDEAATGSGFLNPFPPGDVYKIMVTGDWLADGLAGGLSEGLANDGRVSVQRKSKTLETMLRPEFDEQLKALDEALKRDGISIAVVMLGTQERVSVKMANGRRAAFGTDEWRAELGRRVELVARTFKKHSVAVYWVSLPIMRRHEANEDAQTINAVIRERGYPAGVRYIDAHAGFADEDSEYSPRGPDIAGQTTQLRSADGVGFTAAGNRKLAHFVERELKRDLNQARSDRNIPLAGDEKEQAKVNPGNLAKAAPLAKPAEMAAVDAAKSTAAGPAAVAGSGDQKADNGRINFKMPAQNGTREEVVTLEILRPALPSSVVALVTRKESEDKPAQMGESLVEQAPGGLMLLSSVTPASTAAGAGRRKLAPTQTPYFRVLVKGERLASRPGRADDLVWPPPDPPQVTQSSPEPKLQPATEPAAQPRKAPAARPR